MADHLFTAQPAILFMAQPANFFTAQPAILVMGCKTLLSKMGKPIFVQYFVKKLSDWCYSRTDAQSESLSVKYHFWKPALVLLKASF